MTQTHAPLARPHWHDAYDAQMALWRWYRQGATEERVTNAMGAAWLAESYAYNSQDLHEKSSRQMLNDLYAAEFSRLIDLDPIYVSSEMCDVVEAAAESFAPEALLETDLMTTHGFIYFARPFDVPDRFERPMTIQAASWTRIYVTESEGQKAAFGAEVARRAEESGHIRLGLRKGYAGGGFTAMEEVAEEYHLTPHGIALTIYGQTDSAKLHGWVRENEMRGGWPVVIPVHLTPWYFGMTFDGNEVDEIGRPTGAAWWWKLLQTTFRLMQQRLAHRAYYRPDRAGRREARRLKFRDEAEVVVVRLRREQGESHEPTGEEGNYSHRWIVGGHWRNQPYPKEGIHRQIWISPYVKGPKDKPLIVRPRRVYQWEK